MAKHELSPALLKLVPVPIVLYAMLSLADFGFTLAALVVGAREANPMLAWFVHHGLFEYVKLSVTLLLSCISFRLWHLPGVRRIIAAADVVMLAVLVYHVHWWLSV